MENKKKKSTNSFEKAIMLEVMGKYFLLIATILGAYETFSVK